jgi:hypothetical protein
VRGGRSADRVGDVVLAGRHRASAALRPGGGHQGGTALRRIGGQQVGVEADHQPGELAQREGVPQALGRRAHDRRTVLDGGPEHQIRRGHHAHLQQARPADLGGAAVQAPPGQRAAHVAVQGGTDRRVRARAAHLGRQTVGREQVAGQYLGERRAAHVAGADEQDTQRFAQRHA